MMGEKKRLCGYYNYTVVLTYFGMLAGFTGIVFTVEGSYRQAILCLMVAGVCDMFDGTVAATKERAADERRFGIQIDSLSDLVSFGVLPAIFVFMISGQNPVVGFFAALFTLCALIRLAYFNVLEEARQNQTTGHRKSYLGVPVTTIAVLLPAVYLLYDYRVFKNTLCFPALLILMGVGFLAPIEIKKPGAAGKIGILFIGMLEAVGMFLFLGWGAV